MNQEADKYVPTAMHLYCDTTGKPLVSVRGDGSVDINADVTLDEAAVAFWNAVRQVFDRHQTPPAEMELRAIHATAVTAVLTTDKMLTPDVDAWWPPYLRSVLTQSSRTWFTSTSRDDPADDDQPAHWQYLYTYPFDGTPIWRDDSREWNGQRPRAARGLFTRPTPRDLQEKLRDAQFAIDALGVVRNALGLPPASNVTTDVVQAVLDAQLEATGRANVVIINLVDGVRDVLSRHRITVAAEPTLHESIDTADAFVFSREAVPDTTPSKAARDVLAERRRQITAEGRSLEHDDQNNGGDLAAAASAYALNAACQLNPYSQQPLQEFPIMWPSDWAATWWKPKTPREDLVRAGALILAEIERLDRNPGDESGHHHLRGRDHA